MALGEVGAEAELAGMASRGLGELGVEMEGRPRLSENTDFHDVGTLYICRKICKRVEKKGGDIRSAEWRRR